MDKPSYARYVCLCRSHPFRRDMHTIPDNAPRRHCDCDCQCRCQTALKFAGVLTTSDTNFFAMSGLNIVTARAYTSADDGTYSTVITASQGGQSVSMEFSI
jgi:hypothetical protein